MSLRTKYGTAVLRQLEMMHPKAFFMNRSDCNYQGTNCAQQLLVKAGVSIPKTVFRTATDIDPLIEEIGGMPALLVGAWYTRKWRGFGGN